MPFTHGVLADCTPADAPDPPRWCELTSDGRLVRSKIADPEADDLVGTWPSDAWRVSIEEEEGDGDDEESHEMWGLVKLERWSGRRFTKELREKLEGDALSVLAGSPLVVVRKAATGGMLLLHGPELRHVPATGTPTRVKGDPRDVLESDAGGLFLVLSASFGGDPSLVRPPCPAEPCAGQDFALPNPKGSVHAWEIPLYVARGGHSISIIGEADDGSYLLHYDAPSGAPARWQFEGAPSELDVRTMWPDADGGLWMLAAGTLWHRDATGTWLEVSPPKGRAIAGANRLDPRELLVLVADEAGSNSVYATRGPVTATAPGPSPEPAPTAPAPTAPPSVE